MIGQTISHFRILDKLGEGGMGVVYKAEDIKLKRTVALKFLPQHLTSTKEEQARFLQEAQAAATLNHPNVCTIYGIEEHEGSHFIEMEYVDGVTMREKTQQVPLKINDAISYGIQIGEALHEAHGKGIVHRDIKADNIMVNAKNQVKVMDFGLAKLKGSLKLTRSSSTVGTLAYMAPEQIQGGEVDARSDIFSFGVVIYEMLTGRTPFRGEHDAAMMYSILNEEPDPAEKHRPELSSEFLHILNRALEKDPEDRYQNAHDMVIDLRRLKRESSKVSRAPLAEMPIVKPQEAPQPTPKPEVAHEIQKPRARRFVIPAAIGSVLLLAVIAYLSFFGEEAETGERIPVAVIDFVNETGEKELDGLSGMLITSLEQSRRLAVLTRPRMFDILKQMGKNDVDRIDEALGREISQQANVRALVIASIRKFDELYTIDLKVFDPLQNEYLYTTKEEGEGKKSIPSMIDRLSEKTRVGLKERADDIAASSRKVANVTTTNLEAYQHYFKGDQLVSNLKFDEAEKEFNKAIALDSTFALAYYRLAYAIAWSFVERAKEPIRKAMQYIDKVPEKEQYLIRAENASIHGKNAEAIALYRELLRSYPDEKEALYAIGDHSFHRGDYVTASTHLEKVLAIDAAFERALQHLTWTYRDMQRYEKALVIAQQYVSKEASPQSYDLLGEIHALRGDFEQALETYGHARELFPNSTLPVSGIGEIQIFKEDFDGAEAEFQKMLQKDGFAQKRSAYGNLAILSAYRGKYRDAQKLADAIIEIELKMVDSTHAVPGYIGKAFWLLAGRHDRENAEKAIEKAFQMTSAGDLFFYIPLFQTYLLMSEYEKASSVAADHLSRLLPFLDVLVNAHVYRTKGEYDQAIRAFQTVVQQGSGFIKVLSLYQFGEIYYETGQNEKAIEVLQRMQRLFVDSPMRAVFYPRSYYLLGKIYEKEGELNLAIKNYEKFLTLWKDADKDLPELIDAKARVAKLKGIAAK